MQITCTDFLSWEKATAVDTGKTIFFFIQNCYLTFLFLLSSFLYFNIYFLYLLHLFFLLIFIYFFQAYLKLYFGLVVKLSKLLCQILLNVILFHLPRSQKGSFIPWLPSIPYYNCGRLKSNEILFPLGGGGIYG